MRLQLVLECVCALSDYHIVQPGSEGRVLDSLDPVILEVHLPFFHGKDILVTVWAFWDFWISELQVINSLRELGRELGVHPPDVLLDLLGGLDKLVRVSFSREVINKSFK